MTRTYHIVRIALLLLSAIFLQPSFGFSQSKNPLQLIEGSDDIRLDGKTGNYIVRGNVRLVQDGTKMFCDSAYYNAKKQTVRAYGHVHINKNDSLNLFCDSLYYETVTEFAKLWGNVRVRDLEYKLTTDSLDFYGNENKGVYRNKGKITSILSPETLTSKVGYFYTDENRFFFRGDVVYTSEENTITTDTLKYDGNSKRAHFFGPTTITNPDGVMYCEKGWYDMSLEEGVFQHNAFIDRPKEYIEADSLYYNGKIGKYIAKGEVLLRDTTNAIEFTGDFAKSNEEDRFGFITGHALAKQYDEKNDTLYIHADTLFNFLDSLNESRLMLAYYGVKLFKTDMQGVCDSMSYDKELSEMNMYINPVLWAKNAQLSGDTITVYQENNEIKKARVRLSALVVTEVDTGKYYNQISSKSLTAYFDSTQIRRVDMQGNAKTVYFMEDEKDEDTIIAVERSGMNRIYASDISMYFEGGDIEAATYREAPDGKMYPMDQLNESEQKVENFKWDNTRRPLSWQTMIMTPEEFKKWEIKEEKKKSLRKLKPILNTVAEEDMLLYSKWISFFKEQNIDFYCDSLKPLLEDSLNISLYDLDCVLDSLEQFTRALNETTLKMQQELITSKNGHLVDDSSSVTFEFILERKDSLLQTVHTDTILDSLHTVISGQFVEYTTFMKKHFDFWKQPKPIVLDSIASDSLNQVVSDTIPSDTLVSEPALIDSIQVSEMTDSLDMNNSITETIDSVKTITPKTHPVVTLIERCESFLADSLLSEVVIVELLIELERFALEIRNLERFLILQINRNAVLRKQLNDRAENSERD